MYKTLKNRPIGAWVFFLCHDNGKQAVAVRTLPNDLSTKPVMWWTGLAVALILYQGGTQHAFSEKAEGLRSESNVSTLEADSKAISKTRLVLGKSF
jgi:hypothetical protein